MKNATFEHDYFFKVGYFHSLEIAQIYFFISIFYNGALPLGHLHNAHAVGLLY